MIRVILPSHLRTLAGIDGEVLLDLKGDVTVALLLDTIELRYPMLAGTIRDHATKLRRPYLRFFACGKDVSLQSPDEPLPAAIVSGNESFIIIGSVAGG